MPEGPEIRLAADRIAAVLVDQPIVEVTFGQRRLKRFEPRLTGQVVTAVETRGKAMLTRFDNGLTLYSHNQLYGLVHNKETGAAQYAAATSCCIAYAVPQCIAV